MYATRISRSIIENTSRSEEQDGEQIQVVRPVICVDYAKFTEIDRLRAEYADAIVRPHPHYTLKSLAAIVVGRNITPDCLAKINPVLHEFVQQHTQWFWQIGTFNPLRMWHWGGILIAETHVAEYTCAVQTDCFDMQQYDPTAEPSISRQWVRHGTDIRWDTDGRLVMRDRYRMGKQHGLSEVGLAQGDYLVHQQYVNDSKHGEETQWDAKGRPIERVQWVNGVRHGMALWWNHLMKTIRETSYTRGSQVGYKRIYCQYTGAILSEMPLCMSIGGVPVPHGVAYEWNRSGVLFRAQAYRYGDPLADNAQLITTYNDNPLTEDDRYVSVLKWNSRTVKPLRIIPIVNGHTREDMIYAAANPTRAPEVDPLPRVYVTDDGRLKKYHLTKQSFDAWVELMRANAAN